MAARRAGRVTAGLANPLFGLLVLETEVRVGQRLQSGLLDGLPAPVAETVRALVDLAHGLVDLVEEVPEVVDQREVLLALEGRAARVGVLLVEAHLAGHIGLVAGEGAL